MNNKIVQLVLNHYMYLPKILGFSVQEDPKAIIINSDLPSPMFNKVLQANLEQWAKREQDVDSLNHGFKGKEQKSFWNWLFPSSYAQALNMASYRYGEKYILAYIEEVIQRFQGHPFSWWIGSSCNPDWLKDTLLTKGFLPQTTELVMVWDLKHEAHQDLSFPPLQIKRVENADDLQDFISVLETLDGQAQHFYEKWDLLLSGHEQLFVGYVDDHPAVIANFYLENEMAGAFNVHSKAHREITYSMVNFLMNYSRDLNCQLLVLVHPQEGDVSYFENLGFKTEGEVEGLTWPGRE